jgi:hypothetical protein
MRFSDIITATKTKADLSAVFYFIPRRRAGFFITKRIIDDKNAEILTQYYVVGRLW